MNLTSSPSLHQSSFFPWHVGMYPHLTLETVSALAFILPIVSNKISFESIVVIVISQVFDDRSPSLPKLDSDSRVSTEDLSSSGK